MNDVVYGETGNDFIGTSVSTKNPTIYGGKGNDTIRTATSVKAYADGGEDDDLFIPLGYSKVSMVGGAGNDTFWFIESTTASLSGGTGANLYRFDPYYLFGPYHNDVIITDISSNDTIRYDEENSDTTELSWHKDSKGNVVLEDTGFRFFSITLQGVTDIKQVADVTYRSVDATKTLGEIFSDDIVDEKVVTINSAGTGITILSGYEDKTFNVTDYGNKLRTIDASEVMHGLEIYGNTLANRIIGSDNDDTLSGGKGNDTITGGNGADIFIYSAGNDLISDMSANDTLQIGDGTGTYSKATLDNDDVEVTVGDGKVTLVGAALLGKVNIQGTEASVEPKWQLNGTTATYGTAGNTLITVSGVKSLEGISLNNEVVTVSAAALDTSKVTISDGYTLALGKDAAVPKTVAANYNANTQTYTSAGTTAGYALSNDAKTINYTAGTSKEFKFSGIESGATASNFYVSGNTITIGKATVKTNGTPVKILTNGYTLKLGRGMDVVTNVKASYDADTQTYTSAGTTAGYALSSDAKTINYSAGTSKEFKFSGVADGAVASNFYPSGKTITIGKAAVKTDGTPVKILTNGYTLKLGKGMGAATNVAAKYDADTMTYTSAGSVSYKLSNDAKSISTTGTSKQFAFSGIADGATASNFYPSGTTITIGKAAVKTDGTPVKILTNGYTLKLGKGMDTVSTVAASYDAKTMTYTSAGKVSYVLSNDAKSISTTGTVKQFEFSGVADGATASNFYPSGTTITIGKAAVKTDGTPVKLLTNGYTLRLGKGMTIPTPVGTTTLEDGFYTVAGQTAGYALSSDAKSIKYREALDTTLELSGIATKPTAPTNGVVTLKPVNFDKSLSVMSNDGGYVFSMAKGTYTGKTFIGSANADTITSAGTNLVINAGKGDDLITNSGSGAKINGGAGSDKLTNDGANVTLTGGTGDDTLWGGDYNDTFAYNNGDGNDIISGFDDNDLLQITGTFTTAYDSATGTVKFTVGTGSITLTDFTATTFNVNGDAYQISGKTLVKK